MKKALLASSILLLALAVSSCAVASALPTPTPVQTPSPTPALPPEEAAIDAAAGADELLALSARFIDEGKYEAAYLAAQKAIDLKPDMGKGYTAAADALLAMAKDAYARIDQLLAQGIRSAEADAKTIREWAEQNDPDLALAVPFVADYASPAQINTAGITTGNLSNAAKYDGQWHGGLLTWQGDWVYFARPDEGFAIYKARAGGSGCGRIGEARGSSLNVLGDWLYYLDADDGTPHKMRTDGTMSAKIGEDGCGFLSVSGDWMYFDNGSDDSCLYRMKTDGSSLQKLTDRTAIFPCVFGEWVYYVLKSADGGLWRVSVDGGAPQRVAPGDIRTYSVADDWVYYMHDREPYGIRRVRTDGTGDELLFPYDVRIPTFNAADGALYICFGVGYEEDGFTISQDILTIDIATLAKGTHIEADTEPLCTGPGGWAYFLKYSEDLAWYAMDKDGKTYRIE